IENAMNPAEVVDVIFGEEENEVTVVVPDYQLSLAIGKRGQNARLAARLTSYKIDIKSESDYALLQEQMVDEIEEEDMDDQLTVFDDNQADSIEGTSENNEDVTIDIENLELTESEELEN
ncbi:hypothetical protein KN506_19080, partial [Acinetobacter baumannii]|uniref:hypothetical protein n=1 Tax=Acinetobacter baumannii TaxID=470 RepID=UPI002A0AFEAF|nr:hypothetical protein [Acinetobacter baumannii]